MVLMSFLLLLLALLAYLLLMPLELCLDSYRQRYYLRMGFLARASVEADPLEVLRLRLKVLFLNFYWRPSGIRSWGKGRKKGIKAAGRGRKEIRISRAQGRRLLRSFRVKAFRLELDTGDPVLNARLYPIVFLLGQRLGDMQINFRDRNHLLLQVVNRPIYILNAFINLKQVRHGFTF